MTTEPRSSQCHSHTNKGFSLIEVLVTVFVLSIAMLGIAGMQTTSLRLSKEAHLRSQATELAYDIIARIRANPNADYTVAIPAGGGGACINNDCDQNQLRDFDLTTWNNQLLNQFPNALPTITNVVIGGVTHTQITITWYERVEGLSEVSANTNPQIDILPRPYTITIRQG